MESAHFLCFSNGIFMGTEFRTLSKSDASPCEYFVKNVSTLEMRRFGTVVSAQIDHRDHLDADGNLLDFQLIMGMGGEPVVYRGARRGDTFLVSTRSQGNEQQHALNTPQENFGGAYALETELRLKPLALHEKRTLLRLDPSMLVWVSVELECVDVEETLIFNGQKYPLYRVESRSTILAQESGLPTLQRESLWCDGDGRIWKRSSSLLGMTSWRVSSDLRDAFLSGGRRLPDFLNKPSGAKTSPLSDPSDFAENFSVPVVFSSPEPPDWSACREAQFIVRWSDSEATDDLSAFFSSSAFQKVEKIDDRSLRVTTRHSSQTPFEVSGGDAKILPREGDLEPNNLIQCDDDEILALANRACGDLSGALEEARALTSFASNFIVEKTYARGFVTAAEVARKPAGDCTEHAVFLAALARARKIPTRVVQGLIYVPENKKMVWHVWNEMFVSTPEGGCWLDLDATLSTAISPEASVPPNHLRINSSDFSSARMAQTLLPCANLVGKIEIELIYAK